MVRVMDKKEIVLLKKFVLKMVLGWILLIFMTLIMTKPAQAFYLGEYYYLESALDRNKVVDVNGGSCSDGANIQLWEKNGSDAQLFRIEKNGNGYYAFINKGSNKAIDVYGAYTYRGANVNQWSQNHTSAQQWKLYSADGYSSGYRIKNKCGKYLDVNGANTQNGTNIQIWDRNNSKAQVFRLVPYAWTEYVTKTLGAFSNLDEWAKQMQYAEQSAVGFSRLSYNLDGKLTNYGKMITSGTILQYKTITITYDECGQKKTVSIKLPSKVRFGLHRHAIKQTVWFDFSNINITQTCACGERSDLQWKIPYPSQSYFNMKNMT